MQRPALPATKNLKAMPIFENASDSKSIFSIVSFVTVLIYKVKKIDAFLKKKPDNLTQKFRYQHHFNVQKK